jgi:hypothetical protein
MKKNTRIPVLAAIVLITSMTACKKNLDTSTPADASIPGNDTTHTVKVDTGSRVSYPQQIVTRCPGAPSYGDSIIFMQPSTTDYIIKPINHPDTGTYFAWPVGMRIDKNTGAINVSKSEGGLRYNIGYVRKGTTDTCLQTLILAGISYADSLYVLNNDERYAKPYYNADPTLAPVCSGSGVPGGSTCSFDITGQANSQHVVIDHNSGIIDLKNTASKAFGLIPLNGTTVTTTFAYQLGDNSNMATQYITVNIVYYNKKSDVPPSLLSAVTDKLNKILNQVLLINLGNTSQQMNYGNPRPPIIVVTRFAL